MHCYYIFVMSNEWHFVFFEFELLLVQFDLFRSSSLAQLRLSFVTHSKIVSVLPMQ